MTPTVGRIVHYYASVAEEDEPHAAMITAVRPDVEAGPGHVDLAIFDHNGLWFHTLVPFRDNVGGEDATGECWTWPPRVS